MKYLFQTPQKAAKYNFQSKSNLIKITSIYHSTNSLHLAYPTLYHIFNTLKCTPVETMIIVSFSSEIILYSLMVLN